MKKVFTGLLGLALTLPSVIGAESALPKYNNVRKLKFNNDSYYALLSTAIDASDTNTFEDNKNPSVFDATSNDFIDSISIRSDSETQASTIIGSSAIDFSEKYSKTFSTSLEMSLDVSAVTTDISGKFDNKANTESWKQKIESYEYYYWLHQSYIVNVDWNDGKVCNALSNSFKRELSNVNSVLTAKTLLRKYGTHVYDTYVLGGKLELTKYYAQDASYELSESEKSVAASLNVIVHTAEVDARAGGSVDLSTYESNSSSSSSYYSKLSYHSYGGNSNNALTASDLFQYKTQFGSGTESGFLYEAWTNSFNKGEDVSLKVVSAKNAIPLWDVIDKETYSEQIPYLKKAFDNMCYESYAKKCESFSQPCDYISSLSYSSKDTAVSVVPTYGEVKLPENVEVSINLNDIIANAGDSINHSLRLSSDVAATLEGNLIKIKSDSIGKKFNLELLIDDLMVYSLPITIEKEGYGGGYGTAQQPYLIGTSNEMRALLENLSSSNNCYKLIQDIDFEGEKINSGGSGSTSSFLGTFDGNYHCLKNGTILSSNFSNGFPYAGLFGKNEGTIESLIVDNFKCLVNGSASINNSNIDLCVGILTGLNEGIIDDCQIKDSSLRISSDIKKNDSALNIGGIVGASTGVIKYSSLSNCSVFGANTNEKGTINVGGICGKLIGSRIAESYVSLSLVNVWNDNKCNFSLGGIAGKVAPRTAEDMSLTKPKLNMCIVYDFEMNKHESTTGNIAGVDDQGEFSNCYYKALKEQSVAGGPKNGCYRKDTLKVSSLPSSFNDNWIDGDNGPVLRTHVL